MEGKVMRRKLFNTGMILTAIIAVAIVIQVSAPTPPLNQTEIEAAAVAYAQKTGLQNSPTNVVSKQITRGEFNARLDPFSNDSTDPANQVWLVIMKGDFTVNGLPDQNNAVTSTKFDNGWVLLGLDGKILGHGNQAPGYELDLNAPIRPIIAWPTPENPIK